MKIPCTTYVVMIYQNEIKIALTYNIIQNEALRNRKNKLKNSLLRDSKCYFIFACGIQLALLNLLRLQHPYSR
jgi:hypothetical protein